MNSKQTIAIWSRVLDKALVGKNESEQAKTISRLKEILKRRKKGYLLPKILENVAQMAKKRVTLEIIFGREQPKDLTVKLGKKLESSFGGGKETDVRIDGGIIGGFVAKTDQYLLDASIKNCLAQLKGRLEINSKS